MDIPALLTLVEALNELSIKTARVWSRSSFFHLVVELALPMRAIVPSSARPMISAGEGFVSAQLPYPGRRLAVLSTPQIKDLWVHGECLTRSVALEAGEPGYLDWSAVKARREAMNRSAHTPESWNANWPDSDWHDGELMGECTVSLFNEAVRVTDDTCRVPRETVAELLAFVVPHTVGSAAPAKILNNVQAPGLHEGNEISTHSSGLSRDQSSFVESAGTAADVANAYPHHTGANAAEDQLASLFDNVRPEELEQMFPTEGKWTGWAERAARNGLKEARRGRGLFNPYIAAMWFLKQGEPRWDLARCHRVLAKNLPARSRGEEHKLTGLLD